MDVSGGGQEPPEQKRFQGDQVVKYLASGICLACAAYSYWTARDVVVFLLLVGVGTGQIPIWEAVGRMGRRKRDNGGL